MSEKDDPPGQQHTSSSPNSPASFKEALIRLLPRSYLDVVATIGLFVGLAVHDPTILTLSAAHLFAVGAKKVNDLIDRQ